MMKKYLLIATAGIISLTAAAQNDPGMLGTKLKKSITYEKLLRYDSGLPVEGRIVPIHSSLERPSLWSIGSETLDRDFAIFDNYKQYIGETGVGYARIQSGWNRCETTAGVYDFAWLDKIVDGLLEQGVRPWVCLCYGCSVYMENYRKLADLVASDKAMEAWENYVKTIVKHYNGKINLWEVWNEPDLRERKHPDSYAKFFVRTAKAVKEADADAKVAIFGLSDLDKPFVEPVLEHVKKLGGCKYMDYATYHAYFRNPDIARDLVVKFAETVHGYNPKTVILQGETGCPAQLEYAHALPNVEWTEVSQAKWDSRQMLTQFSLGVPSSVFTMVDLNYGNMMQSFGLIRMSLNSIPQYKRPKFYAVQNITSILTADCKANDSVKITSCNTAEEITVVGLEKNGKTVGYFMWFGGDTPSSEMSRQLVDMTVVGATLEKPVYVDLLNGKVHSLAECIQRGAPLGDRLRLVNVPLWDGPILIVNSDEIPFK